jgi:hypothetical protein
VAGLWLKVLSTKFELSRHLVSEKQRPQADDQTVEQTALPRNGSRRVLRWTILRWTIILLIEKYLAAVLNFWLIIDSIYLLLAKQNLGVMIELVLWVPGQFFAGQFFAGQFLVGQFFVGQFFARTVLRWTILPQKISKNLSKVATLRNLDFKTLSMQNIKLAQIRPRTKISAF